MATGLVIAILLTGCGRNPVTSAIRAIENGDLKKAEALLDQTLLEDSSDVSALGNLAIIRFKNGQFNEAMDGFAKVADLVPGDPRPLEYIAAILMEEARWKEATDMLAEAARRDPGSSSILTALAVIEANNGNAPTARARLVQVLNRDPVYAPALFNIAVIERDWLKVPSRGRRYFQRYIAATRNDPHLLIARAALADKSALSKQTTTSPAPAAKPVRDTSRGPR